MKLVTVILAWWLAIIWSFTEVFPRPYDDVKNTLLYVGGGLCVTWLILRRGIAIPSTALTTGLVLYCTICIISILLSPMGYIFGFEELSQLLLWIAIAWFFSQQSSTTILYISICSITSAVLIIAAKHLLPTTSFLWSQAPFVSPIGHITYYSDFIALQIPLVFYLSTKVSRKIWVPLTTLLVIIILEGLWESARRASILGCVGGILIMIIGLHKIHYLKRKQIYTFLALTLIVGAAITTISQKTQVSDPTIQRLHDMVTLRLEDASSNRWHTYLTTLSIIRDRPIIGWGLDNFRFIYPEYAHRKAFDSVVTSHVWFMHPHNELLHQTMELGIPGLFLFLLGCVYIYRRGFKDISKRPFQNQILIITSLMSITIALISWQFSTNYIMPITRLYIAFSIGILFYATANNSSRILITSKILAAIIVLVLTLNVALNQTALIYVQRTQTASSLQDRISESRMAARLAPHNFDAQFTLAANLMQANAPEAAAVVSQLYNEYPFVPAVLYMKGVQALRDGDRAAARSYFEHSLHNDPSNQGAHHFLKSITH
ncbi:MAG: hypothetical protein COV45_02435 [Deltaproteobacteria bacterium CG11_big_fil_rev_8_21_14_0_20_47_16]|nr:MAG: hypothetical protein COV45_02435 [Deltaproteobacteria bacterium CG11_big_fil_rev_8_21_14_0_20_47_16]